jgi:symmetrical bis(5'-nucleosyl)-tetraphosphatase
MATYLVGDIQGCLPDLKKLLAQANFDPHTDHLWLAGDLVARGPESLETLRFVKALGDHATVILGNHDLHLLAVSHQLARAKKSDHIHQIFTAEDGPELLNWLRHQPLLAEHPHYPLVMVHAGITPQWTLAQARQHAQEVEQLLQSDDYLWLLKNMYGDGPDWWQDDLSRLERLQFTINATLGRWQTICDRVSTLRLIASYKNADSYCRHSLTNTKHSPTMIVRGSQTPSHTHFYHQHYTVGFQRDANVHPNLETEYHPQDPHQ